MSAESSQLPRRNFGIPSLRTKDTTGESTPPTKDYVAFSRISERRGAEYRLQLRFVNGNRQSLGYAYLIDVQYDPSSGIELVFTSHRVQFQGRNLLPLFEGISDHQIKWIQEIDPLQSAGLDEESTVVTSLHVASSE